MIDLDSLNPTFPTNRRSLLVSFVFVAIFVVASIYYVRHPVDYYVEPPVPLTAWETEQLTRQEELNRRDNASVRPRTLRQLIWNSKSRNG